MESCVSQHYAASAAASAALSMGEYVQVGPDMAGPGCNPAMYLDALPPGVPMPEYPWMKEKKAMRKPNQQGKSSKGIRSLRG